VALDDLALTYGPAAAVPEPGAWAMAASIGLLGLAASRRAQRRS
jgi:hypothetical protein